MQNSNFIYLGFAILILYLCQPHFHFPSYLNDDDAKGPAATTGM